MQEARSVLASLLSRLDADPLDGHTRLEAASLANRLALVHGDPSLADVAEAIACEQVDGQSHWVEELAREAAVARAARRAIALAHRQGVSGLSSLALALTDDPSRLASDIRDHLAGGRIGIARATLEVARMRHPENSALARASAAVEQASANLPDGAFAAQGESSQMTPAIPDGPASTSPGQDTNGATTP